MAIISAFQAEEGGSIPPTRSENKTTHSENVLFNNFKNKKNMKKILIICIAVALIVLLFVLRGNKTMAPASEQKSSSNQVANQTKPQTKNIEQSVENKTTTQSNQNQSTANSASIFNFISFPLVLCLDEISLTTVP